MEPWLHLRLGRHRLNNRIAHVARMGRGEAYSLDAVDRRDQVQEAAKVGVAQAIGINGLAEQHDLSNAACGKSAYLVQKRLGWHAALASAHIRHHAKRTEAVASAHRGNERTHPVRVLWRDI